MGVPPNHVETHGDPRIPRDFRHLHMSQNKSPKVQWPWQALSYAAASTRSLRPSPTSWSTLPPTFRNRALGLQLAYRGWGELSI